MCEEVLDYCFPYSMGRVLRLLSIGRQNDASCIQHCTNDFLISSEGLLCLCDAISNQRTYYTAIFWLILRLQHWYFQSKLIWQKQHWDCFNKESLLKYNKRPARVITLFTKLESLGSSVICYTYGSREEIIQIPFFFPITFFSLFLILV